MQIYIKLLQKLLRPTVWVTAERGFSELFFLLLFAVQAPLLGPAAFGLIAAVMVFVGFWEQVLGHAVTEALVSIRGIDDLHYSTTTAASALLCVIFAAGAFAGAEPFAVAFGDHRLVAITHVMAIVPLIQAFAIAPTAAAQRDLRFQSIALRTILSLIAGGSVGLILALLHGGVWALVWQAVVQRLVAVVVLWVAVPIRPSLRFSWTHLSDVATFAVPVTFARIMAWASGQFPRVMLGLYLGPTDLGLFTIASRLSYIISQVAILPKTTVARVDLRRFDIHRQGLGAAVGRVLMQTSIITMPLCIGGAAITPTLFHAWLDPRWYNAIGPTELMLLSNLPAVTFYVTSGLLLALNYQTWEAGVATMQSICVLLGVAIGAPFGILASAAAIAAISFATLPFPVLAMRRKCGLSLGDIVWPQVPATVAAAVMGLAVWYLRSGSERAFGYPAALGLLIGLGALIYVAFVAALLPRQTRLLLGYVVHRKWQL